MTDDLKDILKRKNKSELIVIAISLKFKNVSKLDKNNLIEKILKDGDKKQINKLFSKPNLIQKILNNHNFQLFLVIITILSLLFGVYELFIAPKKPTSDELNKGLSEIKESSDEMKKGLREIKEDIDSIKEYKSHMTVTNSTYTDYLAKKYTYGYVLFGVWDGNFIYNPKLKSSDLKIKASWDSTKFEWDKKSNTVKLTIFDLIMKSDNVEINCKRNETNKIPILPIGEAALVSGIYFDGGTNMYLELLDKTYRKNPIFAIGFKKNIK